MCIFIECRLNAISMAQSEAEYADMVRDLKEQPIYLQNKSLQGWLEKRWLSEYKVSYVKQLLKGHGFDITILNNQAKLVFTETKHHVRNLHTLNKCKHTRISYTS